MKYQNMRGGRVKLHHIMVRNLLFFSAKKREKFWCLNYLINHHCKWLLKENALISNQFLLTNYLRKCRNFSLENFHLDILAQRVEAAQWKTLLGSLRNDDGNGYGYHNYVLQTLSRLFHLVQFVKCWQFLWRKRLYRSSGKEKESLWLVFTSSRKREIRHCHVVVVQRRQGNVQKSVMHVQSCCFSNLRPCWHGVGDPGLVG